MVTIPCIVYEQCREMKYVVMTKRTIQLMDFFKKYFLQILLVFGLLCYS